MILGLNKVFVSITVKNKDKGLLLIFERQINTIVFIPLIKRNKRN